jgi:hypothetical protein
MSIWLKSSQKYNFVWCLYIEVAKYETSFYCTESEWLSGIALDYGLDDRGFESRQRLGIFLFTAASRQALGPSQSPIQWIPGALFLGVKQPAREADHSTSLLCRGQECVELYLHSPNTPS